MNRSIPSLVAAAAGIALSAAAVAHVVLPPGGAAAGSTYAAAFRVGHACTGARATTALSVHLPPGFSFVSAQARAGWTLTTSPTDVSWTASSPQSALPGSMPDNFVITGKLTSKPGTLWFKAVQTCDVGSADWAEVPAAGAAASPAFPAARLDVLPPGVAAVDVRDAYVRPTVAGQTASGIYARLTAPAGSRLIGVSTPVATEAAVHEMKMEGDIMRMREVQGGLDLPPGQPVQLAPGGYHVMLTGLKAPLTLGNSIPLKLQFVDRDGRQASLEIQVPVAQAPTSSGEPEHHHH